MTGTGSAGPDWRSAGCEWEERMMGDGDAELGLIRQGVNCAAVLEHQAPAWLLGRRGSTRRALKYRRGDGEITVVNHDGRG